MSSDASNVADASNAADASNVAGVTDNAANPSVQVIMRQTDYSIETAQQKLTEHNNDVMAVIREYMNPMGKKNSPPPPKLSTNQQIYKEIRGWMDTAAKTYYQPTENK